MKLEVLRTSPTGAVVGRPLLMVHGVNHAAWCWENWQSWFSERGREVHAVSLRGHGRSAGRSRLDDFGLEDYRDDVLNVAGAMDRPILVAHSMGGAVAQLAVAAAPSLFSGLVLVASPPPDGLRIREMLPLLFQVPGLLRLRKLSQGRPLTAREVQALPFFDGRIRAEDAVRYGEQLQPESRKAGREAAFFRALPFDTKLPVLAIGSRRDRLLPVSALKRSATYYSADLIVLDAPCHDLMLDREWDKAAARLDGWMASRNL